MIKFVIYGLLSFSTIVVTFSQEKRGDLHLFFQENGDSIVLPSNFGKGNKVTMIKSNKSTSNTFTYVYRLSKKGYLVIFYNYKETYSGTIKFSADTISLDSLKKIELKDIKWLKTEYKKHFFMNLNELYNCIYLYEISPLEKAVIKTRVIQEEIPE